MEVLFNLFSVAYPMSLLAFIGYAGYLGFDLVCVIFKHAYDTSIETALESSVQREGQRIRAQYEAEIHQITSRLEALQGELSTCQRNLQTERRRTSNLQNELQQLRRERQGRANNNNQGRANQQANGRRQNNNGANRRANPRFTPFQRNRNADNRGEQQRGFQINEEDAIRL